MKIAIGCDPNAETLKTEILKDLESLGHEVSDFGDNDPIYANVVIKVAEAVVKKDCDRGIVLCGTGIGASIAANKVPGAYCALVTDVYQAERAALSNNANIIALGQQVTGVKVAQMIVKSYIQNADKFDFNSPSASKMKRIQEYASEHERKQP